MRTLVGIDSRSTAFEELPASLFRFIARFARVRIEDPSFNRFALNGIQRDFFGGDFFRGDFIRLPWMHKHAIFSGQEGGGVWQAGKFVYTWWGWVGNALAI